MKKVVFVFIVFVSNNIFSQGCSDAGFCTSENMKYICNVKQTKSVSLNNKKAGDFKSHLLHISLANVVVSFLLCKFFVENLSIK